MYLTENWRLKGPRYLLTTTRNRETQQVTFPPRKVAIRELDLYKFDLRAEKERKIEEGVAEAIR